MIKDYQMDLKILRAEITSLYKKLDSRFRLYGALLPIEFVEEEDKLGSYQPADKDREEGFTFSLPFISYTSKNQLDKNDRQDLYLHEYAHYMRHHLEIPKEYDFEGGHHGSAWRYCCSLIDAVPSPYYRVGESLKKKDYDKVLKNNWSDNTKESRMIDAYRVNQQTKSVLNNMQHFYEGDTISHPRFGTGIVEKVEPTGSSVRLTIRFGEEIKTIDQHWLLKARCVKISDR